MPETTVGEGAHAELCGEEVTMLLVFDTPGEANRYIASVDNDDFDQQMIAGKRWVVVGDKVASMASKLGGRVIEK